MNTRLPIRAFTTTDDALVLASVSSPAEEELLTAGWTGSGAAPGNQVEVLKLPSRDPPPAVLAQLVEKLEADEDRSVVPVRVFWVPAGRRVGSQGGGIAVGP